MKTIKFMFLAAIITTLAACGTKSKTEEGSVDSTAVDTTKVDTTAQVTVK